jgi:lycopene cyclase domain-containing protein
MSLYFTLLLISLAFPLALSFDKNLRFYKSWIYLFPALIFTAFIYLIFDVCLTRWGVWGFNPVYVSAIGLFGLPIEEWLFFIIIPYCSIFLHDVMVYYFPQYKLNAKLSRFFSSGFIVLLLMVAVLNFDKAYTVYMALTVCILLLITLFSKYNEIVQHYFITFLAIAVPFLLINGILTGSLIDGEVVWYNNNENLGIRLFTIPVEDIGYGFGLILFNLLLRERIKVYFAGKNIKTI